jgi:hypothetical protein
MIIAPSSGKLKLWAIWPLSTWDCGSRNKPPQREMTTTTIRQQLQPVRDALLHLHKALIDSERVSYEKANGAIRSPNHFLQLLTSDPWFAWLRALSELIVAMDEALDEREPLTVESAETLNNQTRLLLVASESGEGFSRHYFDALHRDPNIAVAHADVAKLLGDRPTRAG